ncbi:MAG: hypothetical protein IJV80_05500, partial [Clostridia bacterium]|nr:hypothetical protein [Clostridia bacterium]
GILTYADVNTVLGTADFDGACDLCADLLRANGTGAYEKTEAFLAAGKSVSMLIKDVLSCLNACALVKTCRNANAMLGYPAERFERVKQAVQEVDGHRNLRVTQIFAEIETSLRYSSTPRVLFEAAVLEASMPEEDYETEALIARIADLEKEVKLLKEGGRVAISVPQSVPVASEKPIVAVEKEPKKEEVNKTETVVEDEYIGQTPPPDEEETGGFVYFDTPPQTAPKTAAVSKRPPQATSDAKATYGSFLRAIRRASKNAVLVTMCMDLDCHYEGGLFVCETTSDTAYRSLQKSEHYAVLQAAFAEIGIAENGFEVRLRAKDGDAFNSAVAEIRKSFSGVNVKLK